MSDEQKLVVGSLIHERMDRKTQVAFRRSVGQKSRDDELQGLFNRLDKIELPVRLLWQAKWQREHPGEIYNAENDHSPIGALLHSIESTIIEGQLQGQRLFTAPHGPAKGVRKEVLRFAAWALRRCGFEAGERTAEVCLEAYRAHLKQLPP